MSAHTVRWYFQPHDDYTNRAIAALGDPLEECHDKLCFDRKGKSLWAHLWLVPESKAALIYNSRRRQRFSFTLYKQVGEGDIKQHDVMRAIKQPDTFTFKVPHRRRKKPWVKGSSLLRRMARKKKEKERLSGVH